MLSLRLFHRCLLLPQLIILSGVTFAALVHDPIVRADLARTPQTLDWKVEPRLLLSVQQSRAHCANILSSLHKRGHDTYVLSNGWLMRFLRIDSGLPISIASALLEDFYQRVLEHVHKLAATVTPSKTVSLGILDLHLDFTCNSTDVSWDFIRAFVTAMLDATKRGFTGKFQAVVFHGPTETAVNVALRVLGPAKTNDSTDIITGL